MNRDRNLDHIVEPFKSKAIELIARCTEAVIPVMIIETLRSQEQHEEDVKTGHSWVKHSKHQDGIAIDICPYEEYKENGPDKLDWNNESPLWLKIGPIG